jgi:hypothetical protein
LPIGGVDSRIGSLTVLEALLTLDACRNNTLQPRADGMQLNDEDTKNVPLSPALIPVWRSLSR